MSKYTQLVGRGQRPLNKTKIFNNADELTQYCIDNNMLVGQIWVESNAHGGGKRTLLFFFIDTTGILNTYVHEQGSIENVDYADKNHWWYKQYKGTFELIIPFDQFTKPEIYQVGDLVEVLENASTITYQDGHVWREEGNTFKITQVIDTYHGVSYRLDCSKDHDILPHYCVKKVEKKMTLQEIEKELGYKVRIID